MPSPRPDRRARRYWLLKSEPTAFSWHDLWHSPARTTQWDGVRNYQARNFMRDEMRRGDLVFFYHSNADPPAVVGVAEIVREGYPDPSAFDATNPHYDAKSTPDAPTWIAVDVRAVAPFARALPLDALRRVPGLEALALFTRPRLSVQPVTPTEWAIIHALGNVGHDAS